MDKEKIKKLIPLGLIVGGLIYTTVLVLTSDVGLTKGHWIAYGLTSLTLVTYLINEKVSNVILGITLVLGLMNLITFTPTTMTVGGGLTIADTDFIISLQVYSLVALITYFVFHREVIKAIVNWFNKDGL